MARPPNTYAVHRVQLELTLDVDVSCYFEGGAWQFADTGAIYLGDEYVRATFMFDVLKLKKEELVELFAQQEA